MLLGMIFATLLILLALKVICSMCNKEITITVNRISRESIRKS